MPPTSSNWLSTAIHVAPVVTCGLTALIVAVFALLVIRLQKTDRSCELRFGWLIFIQIAAPRPEPPPPDQAANS
jgi:hypothetical protein